MSSRFLRREACRDLPAACRFESGSPFPGTRTLVVMPITVTHTRTHNAIRFADPYKRCLRCGAWADGALQCPGPLILVPCEHESGYRDVCPSWGPVDGCTCVEAGIVHDVRTPDSDDGRMY